MAIEIRTGEEGTPNEGAYELGVKYAVRGRKLVAGDPIPSTIVELYDPEEFKRKNVNLAVWMKQFDLALLLSVNSLDTPTCLKQTENWREHLNEAGIGGGLVVAHLSADTTYAQERFSGEYDIEDSFLSTFGFRKANEKLGIDVPAWRGLTQRAGWLTRNGLILASWYAYDQVSELPEEPVINAIKEARAV